VVSVLRSIGSFFIAQVLFGKPSLLVWRPDRGTERVLLAAHDLFPFAVC
jgi:hypothetical protein